jgi:hypothetical protein
MKAAGHGHLDMTYLYWFTDPARERAEQKRSVPDEYLCTSFKVPSY